MSNDPIRDVYNRFKKSKDLHPGIYIYPSYTADLEVLLAYIERQLYKELREGAVNVKTSK